MRFVSLFSIAEDASLDSPGEMTSIQIKVAFKRLYGISYEALALNEFL